MLWGHLFCWHSLTPHIPLERRITANKCRVPPAPFSPLFDNLPIDTHQPALPLPFNSYQPVTVKANI